MCSPLCVCVCVCVRACVCVFLVCQRRFPDVAAAAAIGPYSQAIVANNMVFVSGMIGLHPVTGKLVEGGVTAEAQQALANLQEVLRAAGSSVAKVVKVTVLLTSMDDYAAVNAEYAKVFTGSRPARAAFAVKGLPAGALVEITADAML